MKPLLCCIIAVLNILFCCSSFAQTLIYDSNIPVQKLRVVLEQSRGGSVSDMLTDLEYIPLQGDDKGQLVSYVNSIEVIGDKMGIVSGEGGHFFLFDLDGNFVKKIDKMPGYKIPASRNNNLFYHVTNEDDSFAMYSGDFKVRVDLQGNIVDTMTMSSRTVKDDGFGQYVSKEITLGQSNFKYYGTGLSKDRKKADVLAFNDCVIMTFDAKDSILASWYSEDMTKPQQGKSYMTAGYNTKIFELDSTGIAKIYELILPARNTLDIKSTDVFKSDDFGKFQEYINNNKDKVISLRNILKYKDYIIFQVFRWHGVVWLAVNTKTNDVIGLSNIISDKSNDFMPLYDVNYLFAHEDYLYSFIYPSQVSAAKGKSADERHTMRKAYLDLEKSMNPILVRFKLK